VWCVVARLTKSVEAIPLGRVWTGTSPTPTNKCGGRRKIELALFPRNGERVEISGNFFWLWLALTAGALCFLAVGFALTTIVRAA